MWSMAEPCSDGRTDFTVKRAISKNVIEFATPDSVVGAQTIERACKILRALAKNGRTGSRLIDVRQGTGLSHPTAHRILQSLVREGLVTRHRSRRYGLGPALYELGLIAPTPVEDFEQLRPHLQSLADRCGDSCYLMVRRGHDVVYLMRAEGAYPIRAYTIAAGERLPMPASLGGIALMANLPDEIIEEILTGVDPLVPAYRNASKPYVRLQIEFIRKNGYGWGVNVVMEGVGGLSCVVPNPNGVPYLALSVSAITSRVTPERAPQVAVMMRRAADDIAGQIASDAARRTAPAEVDRSEDSAREV
jgi:DNA-binding IclR family transcriptional regulator